MLRFFEKMERMGWAMSAGGQDGERYLVEQGLEGVVIATIDQGHVDGHVGQGHSSRKAGEAAADHDHPGARGQVLHRGRS